MHFYKELLYIIYGPFPLLLWTVILSVPNPIGLNIQHSCHKSVSTSDRNGNFSIMQMAAGDKNSSR